VIGTVIGSLQGYLGGRFDILSQRVIEVLIAIPFLYVVIIMAALFAPTFWMLLAIMALFQWITITFYMRTEMYREKTREYCLAARSYGASHLRIIFRHLLPNSLTPLVTFTPFAVVAAIFALTGLDYLGYGLPAPTPSWGELIDQALQLENRNKLWLTFRALRGAHRHARARRLHRRVGARGVRPQAVRALRVRTEEGHDATGRNRTAPCLPSLALALASPRQPTPPRRRAGGRAAAGATRRGPEPADGGAALARSVLRPDRVGDEHGRPADRVAEAIRGGTFNYFMSSYPLTFRLMGPNSNDVRRLEPAFTMDFGLVGRHPVTDRYIPIMATHWSVQDDQRTIYFRLDPDARWSDGTPITADDYVFTWR
jgi:hypothetical protein